MLMVMARTKVDPTSLYQSTLKSLYYPFIAAAIPGTFNYALTSKMTKPCKHEKDLSYSIDHLSYSHFDSA